MSGAIALLLSAFAALPACAARLRFETYSPLASNTEMARRLLSPLTSRQIPARLKAAGARLGEQPIDLANEMFDVYQPNRAPPGGYGLIVFIPPWPDGHIPDGWASAFDRLGFIFVSALRSGNDENVLARREPLAILAAVNAMQLYPVDRNRVFIAGFSGGSRIAMRLAVAYPDLFRGALLDAGSDPIGGREIPLPPRDLFEQFRRNSLLVYATGALDDVHMSQDAASMASMRSWCMTSTIAHPVAGLSHDPVPASALSIALTALTAPRNPPSATSDACWTRAVATMDAQLDDVAAAIQQGDTHRARKRLQEIDDRYGGLAVPRIDALADRLDFAASPAPAIQSAKP